MTSQNKQGPQDSAFLPQKDDPKSMVFGLDIPRHSSILSEPSKEWLEGRFAMALEASLSNGPPVPEKALADMLLALTYNMRGAVSHDMYAAMLMITSNLHGWQLIKNKAKELLGDALKAYPDVSEGTPTAPVTH